MRRVVAEANASTSNLGPGYDVLGIALDVMRDTVEACKSDSQTVTLEVEGLQADTISLEPTRNTAGRVALEFFERYRTSGFRLKVTKGVPPGSGLGSSGATAAATTVALDRLLGLDLSEDELVGIAARGEIATAGAPVADNVASAILGGFVIIRSYQPLRVLHFKAPKSLALALALPKAGKKTTEQFRAILPTEVPLNKVIENLGATSCVVAGLLTDDIALAGSGMMGDQIVEPVRARCYVGFEEARNAALAAGAAGVFLSGAGPSVVAVVDINRVSPQEVAEAMRDGFLAHKVPCDALVSSVGEKARVVLFE